MTGPTTAAELVDLAVGELHELQRRAGARAAAATAPELAAGWPAFSRSAHRLLAALNDDLAAGGVPPTTGSTASSAAKPDLNLLRAADYLGAAADLLDTRDRRPLTAQQCSYDAEQIIPYLAATGYLVAATTAAHPALLGTAADVSAALKAWQPGPAAPLPGVPPVSALVDAGHDLQQAADHLAAAAALLGTRGRQPKTAEQRAADAEQSRLHLNAAGRLVAATTAGRPSLLAAAGTAPTSTPRLATEAAVSSLVDVSTVASVLSGHTPGELAGSDAASPALAALHEALHGWQRAALAVTHQPAPSSSDLLGATRTAGMLTRLAHNLLTAHADPARDGAAAAAVSQELRQAGAAWNVAAGVWRATVTGGQTLSPDARQAGAALETAVRAFARAGADWTSPHELRAQAGPDLAAQLARTALAAAQAVAEQHAPLVARLGQTGALYTQAQNLPVPETVEESEQRVADRLAGRFTPIGPGEAEPFVAAYQRLPQAAAAARTAYAALTGPAPALDATGRQAAERPQEPRSVAERPPVPGDEQRSAVPVTLAGQRWQQTLAEVDPRLLDDPHYPALAAALDRIQLAGVDVPASLAAAAAQPLPDEHAARALHWQLVDLCPAAITPYTDTTGPSRPPAQPAALEAAAAVRRATPPAAARIPR